MPRAGERMWSSGILIASGGIRFGLVDARASFASDTEIVCVAPFALAPGRAPLAVTNNGADFFAAAGGADFAYEPTLSVVSAACSERRGPSVGGGRRPPAPRIA